MDETEDPLRTVRDVHLECEFRLRSGSEIGYRET